MLASVLRLASLLLCLALFSGCGPSSPTAGEDRLARKACRAIRDNDWPAYSRLTVTTADFVLRSQEGGPLRSRSSYAGGIQKPREKQRQEQDFRRAVAGGAGQIDFRSTRCLGVGTMLESGSRELLLGGSLPYRRYSLRLDGSSGPSDSGGLAPQFVIVRWGGELRLLELTFPADAPALRN